MNPQPCFLLVCVLLLSACGDDSDASGDSDSASSSAGSGGAAETDGQPQTPTEPTSQVPESTADALTAYLEAETYRGAGWAPQTASPRGPSDDVSPHGRVQVWRNDALLASQKAGNGVDLDAPAHDTGSMAVKEFYDANDLRIGQAAMLKLDGDSAQWAYMCTGPDERCMDSSPIHGIGLGVSCSFCHGGLIFTNSQ